MMRTIAVWIGAVLMAGGLWSASAVSQGLADEPAARQIVHLQNHWKPDQYVNIESGTVVAGAIQPGWLSAQWTLEPVPGTVPTHHRIKNLWKPDQYLNIESGVLQAGTIQPGWLSAMWLLEPVPGTVPTLHRIKNLWKPDQYLNIESGVLQAGTIQLGWLSAMWTLSPPVANPTRTILETTYRNPPFNTSSPSWARDLVHGKLLYPSGPTANQIYQVEGWVSRNYTPNEWTQIFNPDEDYEVDAVGLSGRAVVNGNGLSTNDNVFLHPFGTDWEFYIAPDDRYQYLAAPLSNPDLDYDGAKEIAQREFGMQVNNMLGVELIMN